MESEGHRIHFRIESSGETGYILIRRSGWIGFEYKCYIAGNIIEEVTERVAVNQDPKFTVEIIEYMATPDELSEQYIVWYVVHTVRLHDGASTIVHRRFKDFAELNSSVKQNLKGHHLRSSIPPLPTKELKLFTDHQDPDFISGENAPIYLFHFACTVSSTNYYECFVLFCFVLLFTCICRTIATTLFVHF